MGNRPKMSLKFAQNSPENDIHVKQKSIPLLLGIVGDKKWSPFLDLGIRSPIFFAPKITENGRFRSHVFYLVK